MKKKLFVILTAMLLAVTLMPGTSIASWSLTGWYDDGNFNGTHYDFGKVVAYIMTDNGTFETPGLSASGWTGSVNYPRMATLTSTTPVGSLGWDSKFSGSAPSVLYYDYLLYATEGSTSPVSGFRLGLQNGGFVNSHNSLLLTDSGQTGWYELNLNALPDYSKVPIPAAIWLLGTGLVGLFGVRRRLTS